MFQGFFHAIWQRKAVSGSLKVLKLHQSVEKRGCFIQLRFSMPWYSPPYIRQRGLADALLSHVMPVHAADGTVNYHAGAHIPYGSFARYPLLETPKSLSTPETFGRRFPSSRSCSSYRAVSRKRASVIFPVCRLLFLRCLKHPVYHAALYAGVQAPLRHHSQNSPFPWLGLSPHLHHISFSS